MKLESTTYDSWVQVRELHSKTSFGNYALPDPTRTMFSKVVMKDSKIIAFGTIPILAEAVIVVDETSSTRDRITAITMLLEAGISKVRGNLDGIHAFIQDPEFSKLLAKHFGFRKCKGEALYRDVT